jgi:outer membrane protein OmpA-like peptidoglycan-associated protein
MLQAGYDNRQGAFEETVASCDCPADLNTNLSYISIEPSLRFAPLAVDRNFYLYAGPRLAINVDKSFTYRQGVDPATPDQTPDPSVNNDYDNIENLRLSMQVGAGYDIAVSSEFSKTQVVISPFIAYHPYFGQSPRSTESWDLSTLRVGAALKFGQGRPVVAPTEALVPETDTRFYIISPENLPAERVVREVFPLRNYVFFDLGSTEIPGRYVQLSRAQARNFKPDQLELFPPKYVSSRSQRQMEVYYHVLNIIGDRLEKNPAANIRLVGSSADGPDDAMALATSVQNYLVNTFGIDPARIVTEGRDKPVIASEQPGATLDLQMLRQGDRRVSIESSSPELLAEFQQGPDTQLRPVEIVSTQAAPLDSYVSIINEGAGTAYQSWTMDVKDYMGKVQTFGPYTQDRISIPGKVLLGNRKEGTYDMTMKGLLRNGGTEVKTANVRIALWSPPTTQEGLRYSVLFEFDESKAIDIYEKYLTEVVVPRIPPAGTVIIHGHTDVIGDGNYNQNLSQARADEVMGILKRSLAAAGRTDVKFESIGFGEDILLSPFDNDYPEERFYNRTVVIDIIPAN